MISGSTSPVPAARISPEQLSEAVDVVRKMVEGTWDNFYRDKRPWPLTTEVHAAGMLFRAIRAASGVGVFTDVAANRTMAAWALEVPRIVERLAHGGQLPKGGLAWFQAAAPRVQAAVAAMADRPEQGFYRRCLMTAALDLPAAAVREGMPAEDADVDRLIDAMTMPLRHLSGVPEDFVRAGFDAIADAHRAGLINTNLHQALVRRFEGEVASHRREEAVIAAEMASSGRHSSRGAFTMFASAGPAPSVQRRGTGIAGFLARLCNPMRR